MRERRTPWTTAVALGLALPLMLAPSVGAAPRDLPHAAAATDATPPAPSSSPGPDVVLPWDGDRPRSIVVAGELWGRVVVVPGDSGRASVTVRNDGPTAGTLTASIVDVVVHRSPDDPDWVDDLFYDHLTIAGTPVTALEGGRTEFLSVALAGGGTVEIPLDYGFEGWTGNRTGGGLDPESGQIVNPDGVGHREVTFDVLLRIAGDTSAPTPGGDEEDQAVPGAVGPLMATGGAAVTRAPWPLLGGALLAALLLAGARSRRRRAEAPE